jgi:oxygen-independent coproporphyrinogen-3 oxidase
MPGVYISYPFCAQKCTYCNFASGVFPRELEIRYAGALRQELASINWLWTPETVYLGGGTPSQADPATLESILAMIPGRPWLEATIEAAPGTITLEKAIAWRRAGIGRVSLGVQSFVGSEIARTGRKHTAEIVECEVSVLREAGMRSINIDLIAGLPGQTRESWNASLDWLQRIGAEHASIYMLEVDEDSRLGSEILNKGMRYGAADVPVDDDIAEFYEIAVERLAQSGLPRYEISNFAKPGHESRHNLKYWLREPYLGFGADAHSFDGTDRFQNVESTVEYVERLCGPFQQIPSAVAARTPADPVSEHFFLGLRLSAGIDLESARSQFPEPVERFLRDGLLEISGFRLRLTSRGVLLSNEVFAEFIASELTTHEVPVA